MAASTSMFITGLGFIFVIIMIVGLFAIKYSVKDMESELSTINTNIKRNEKAIHVLKAEWSHLNDPARIRKLSKKINLQPVKPSQITTLSSIPSFKAPYPQQGNVKRTASSSASVPRMSSQVAAVNSFVLQTSDVE